jgi:error-prone DNA polymerase
MAERGYSEEFAKRIFEQIQGFGEYGFPESHAASFALLVYVSAWLKCYEPAVFCCALLNSQPMGFYAPAQLVRSAREHGVDVRSADVHYSDWDSTLERGADGAPALRLGLRLVKGMSEQGAQRLVRARLERPFSDLHDLAERAALDAKDLGALAAAGAIESFASHRHRARWQVAGLGRPTPLLGRPRIPEALPMLRRPAEHEDIAADYRHLGLTLRRHPLALLRETMAALGILTAKAVAERDTGDRIYTAGIVVTRQRPSSAAGVTFVTLEDETGYVNLIVWERLAQTARRALLGSVLLGVVGKVQKEGDVLHVVAERLLDHSPWLGDLTTHSRDFH